MDRKLIIGFSYTINVVLGIFSDYSEWKRELGLFLHVSYKYLFWINREIQSNLRG
jgi:hypothetical protein